MSSSSSLSMAQPTKDDRHPSVTNNNKEEKEEEINLPQQNLEKEAIKITSSQTLHTKITLTSGRSLWATHSLPLLLPNNNNNNNDSSTTLPSIFLTDGPHGLRKTTDENKLLLSDRIPSTCFPTSSCLASSWDVSLLHSVGRAIGKECVLHDVSVLLGPGINVKRHPLGGRNFEYYSEDAFLGGTLASGFVRGVQSVGVGASLKHFCVNNHELDRMVTDVIVDERTLREIYFKGFEIVVKEAQPWTVMMAYNRINGVYCTEHEYLTSVLREEWGFEGLTLTDWCATNDRVKAIKAGVDLEMPGSFGVHSNMIKEALKDGSLDIEDLDGVVKRNVELLLKARDTLEKEKERKRQSTSTTAGNEANLLAETNHALAKKVAMQCAILLKNEDKILPLSPSSSQTIAIIGEFAKYPRYQGMGSSQVLPTQLDTAWDYLTSTYTEMEALYAPGYSHKNDGMDIDTFLIDEAVNIANKAEHVILFAGLPGPCESEGFDRTTMSIPPQHEQLIQSICNANDNTIVILSNGPPISMESWVHQPKAIIEGYLAGQGGGSALIDLIFGKASPCGKLAETFPLRVEDVPSDPWFPRDGGDENKKEMGCRRVEYREGLNVGYRYYDTANVDVLFPFGHGLSYTSFEYGPLRIIMNNGDKEIEKIEMGVEVGIKNTGEIAAAEVIQLYVHDVESTVYRPEQELKAFSKVFLEPNERKLITFNLKSDAFHFYDVGVKKWIVEPGEFEIRVGSSSRDIRSRDFVKIEKGEGLQFASRKARISHPPSVGDNVRFPLVVDDDTFARMMTGEEGKEETTTAPLSTPTLSQSTDSKKTSSKQHLFNRNSQLVDLQHSFIGRIIRNIIIRATMSQVDADIAEDSSIRKVAEAMVDRLPVRGFVVVSHGYFTFGALDCVLALLNRQYYTFATSLFGSIFSGLLSFVGWKKGD